MCNIASKDQVPIFTGWRGCFNFKPRRFIIAEKLQFAPFIGAGVNY